ncbi:MAG: carbon-nitrogen hydrolase family protein [Victivallaceae bacterium]|nr:carbon-nitrogen hydrolase family protein [Victivallaceae bacterium]
MAKFVNIASVHFQITAERGVPDAQQKVLEQFAEATERLNGTGVDLLITCEGMESIGQTVTQAESPERPGALYETYRKFAVENRCTVAGSIKLEADGNVYNALAFIGPDGQFLGDYRKNYLTAAELKPGLTPGNGAKVIDTPAGRIGGIICFDLNFDTLRNQYHALQPDILVFSSMFHGDHLQANWAYQCRAFFAAACKDNSSDIVDPLGRVIASTNYYGRIARARVNLDRFIMHQDGNLKRFPDIRRQYGDEVEIEWNSALGVAIMYSHSQQRSASDIAAEFDLMGLDKFLQQSLRVCNKKEQP